MNKRLQYLAGILKEEDTFNPFAEEYDWNAIEAGILAIAKDIMTKRNIPEDTKCDFNKLGAVKTIKQDVTIEEAAKLFIDEMKRLFQNNAKVWVAYINEEVEQEHYEKHPDEDIDEDQLIQDQEQLIYWTVWDYLLSGSPRQGIVFRGNCQRAGFYIWQTN